MRAPGFWETLRSRLSGAGEGATMAEAAAALSAGDGGDGAEGDDTRRGEDLIPDELAEELEAMRPDGEPAP